LRVFSTRATGLAHPNPTDLITPIISCEIRSQNEYKENAEWIFLSYVKHKQQSNQKHYHREIRNSHSGFKVPSSVGYDILSIGK
jgi:hypothetical protein